MFHLKGQLHKWKCVHAAGRGFHCPPPPSPAAPWLLVKVHASTQASSLVSSDLFEILINCNNKQLLNFFLFSAVIVQTKRGNESYIDYYSYTHFGIWLWSIRLHRREICQIFITTNNWLVIKYSKISNQVSVHKIETLPNHKSIKLNGSLVSESRSREKELHPGILSVGPGISDTIFFSWNEQNTFSSYAR